MAPKALLSTQHDGSELRARQEQTEDADPATMITDP